MASLAKRPIPEETIDTAAGGNENDWELNVQGLLKPSQYLLELRTAQKAFENAGEHGEAERVRTMADERAKTEMARLARELQAGRQAANSAEVIAQRYEQTLKLNPNIRASDVVEASHERALLQDWTQMFPHPNVIR